MQSFLMKKSTRWVITIAVMALAAVAWHFGALPNLTHGAMPGEAWSVVLAPFPVTPELVAVAVAYRNSKLIADEVLPRVPVSLQAFKYTKYPLGEFMTIPETKVGRKGEPNKVEFTGQEADGSTDDHGLDDEVPNADIENARAQKGIADPLMTATEGLTELIALAREVRTANMVFDENQYATANKTTLSGTSQWSDYTNSDPDKAINDALDTMIMRPNIAVMGRGAWSAVRRHPRLVKAIYGQGTELGTITRQQFAEYFELEEVFVGEGWVNTAKKGQAVNMQRVWGKHCALLHRNKRATTQGGAVTFGFTAQWGGKIAGSEYDGKIGLRGGQRVRVGESVRELMIANDLGYFFKNVA